MAEAVEQTERGFQISNMLRVIAHTSQVDPEFFAKCIDAARADVTPGFGSALEQNESEFGALLEHARGLGSALEIGSRYGESVKRIAGVLKPGAKVVAVDLPYGSHGGQPDPLPVLKSNIDSLRHAGFDASLFVGDSHAPEVVAAVRAMGPFDFCFIDGDHSYEGVKADWENYGPLAPIVAFHDIINNVDCFRLWNEVKAKHRHIEYTSSLWLGIGVIFKDQ